MGADHPEHGEGERDVGGGRDRPAGQGAVARTGVERDVDQGGDGHPADRGGDRQRRPAGIAQVTGDELAFQLQAGDEEEDREQSVGRPLAHAEVQMQRGGPETRVSQVPVRVAPRGVRPDQREHRRPEQQHPTDRLGTQDVADPADLGPATAPEQRAGWGDRAAWSCGSSGGVDKDIADQTSRHTCPYPTGPAVSSRTTIQSLTEVRTTVERLATELVRMAARPSWSRCVLATLRAC